MVQKKKSNFSGKVASNAAKQKKAGASYGYLVLPKGANVFSPEPGASIKLDFMPYEVTDPKHPDRDEKAGVAVPGSLWWKRPFSTHRNVGSEKTSVVCLSSVGKKCPICEYRAKQIKAGADKEDTDAIKASKRDLFVVIPLNSKKHEATPHIFDISFYNFSAMLTDELEENEEHEIFPDLEIGETVKVRFASKTIGTGQPFAQASRIDFLEREETYEESILEDIPNLDEVLQILSYDELHAKFFEMEGEEDGGAISEEEEEEDEKPVRKKKTLRKPKDDSEEEEEEEEDEKPVRRKRPVRKEEEDEKPIRKHKVRDNEPEEEEEEDEKPARSSKKRIPEKSTGKKKCPHGHKFGVDFDEYDECEDCGSFDECLEENEK